LHQGTLTEAAGDPGLACPWHGSTYRLSDGAVMHGPATARQPAFDTRLAEGGIVQVRPAHPGT
jgi:nitrite reductase/ring-hydroxylating ferredoxin subunit